MSVNNKKIVFIDRDGVINFDSPLYIKNEDEFVFIPGSAEALGLLKDNGFEAIIITNQSVIGRKMVTPEGLEKIFSKMRTGILESGGQILDIFFCPHVPEDRCGCRKPEPGLLNMAKEKYSVDMSASYMIGDTAKDMLAAESAGVGKRILVRTGSGEKTLDKIKSGELNTPDHVADNLMAAVKWIISDGTGLI